MRPTVTEDACLDEAETSQFVEDEIRRHLGISTEEFLRRAEADQLPDHPAVAHLLILTGAETAAENQTWRRSHGR